MNKLVKRGLSAYKIFLKNKLAMSLMMLFSGIMMFIGAVNGRGNDTKTLPLVITAAGIIFSFWAFYKLGYIKANYDRTRLERKQENRQEVHTEAKVMFLQIGEALIYSAVAALGIFLLANQSFTNRALDLMAGGFTTFNGILSAINAYKNRENKNLRWKFTIVLMLFELTVGPYFIFASNSIAIGGYVVMGALTTVAGTIEVISALTAGGIRSTIQDSKDIIHIMKDDKKPEEEEE